MDESRTPERDISIVVAIPCYNEAVTIVKVVEEFRAALPEAEIHVFDNNSTDDSVQIAAGASATVHRVRKQGKGHVVQAIFETLQADAVLIVDGDDTYSAEDAPKLLAPVLAGEADMVVGNRLPSASRESMRHHRQFGNRMIVGSINFMFGTAYEDILSGYRVFSRRFVESVPLLTPGFETETEMTLQALEEGMVVVEIPITYRSRPATSESKLHPFRDGYRIMLTAAILLRDHHPLRIFGIISMIGFGLVLLIGLLVLLNHLGVTNLPETLLTGALLVLIPLSAIALGTGLILNAVNTRFRQLRQLIQRNID
jgi:glycosyltransferase involved in cell wall biosynthesis